MIERERVQRWLADYVAAWKSYDHDQIAALFSEDVVYRYRPQGDEIRGRDAVVASWLEDDPDQHGTYEGEYRTLAVDGNLAVATGVSTYFDSPNGSVVKIFDNCFVIRFAADGRCAEFTEWFIERPS